MSECEPDCDCMVCRNERHRGAVWARHNAEQDYFGVRARIMERVNGGRDPDWKAPHPTPPTVAEGE